MVLPCSGGRPVWTVALHVLASGGGNLIKHPLISRTGAPSPRQQDRTIKVGPEPAGGGSGAGSGPQPGTAVAQQHPGQPPSGSGDRVDLHRVFLIGSCRLDEPPTGPPQQTQNGLRTRTAPPPVTASMLKFLCPAPAAKRCRH